jgi:uncharacterized protein
VSIKEQILSDLKEAQKEKETNKVQLLRTLISSIKNFEIENKSEISDDQAVEVLRKEVKQRKEALDQYQKAKREDLAKTEKQEIEIIEKYLPKLMSESEIEEKVKEIIKKTGADDPSQIGLVMGQAMSELKGKAEGNKVKEIATKLLKK